MAKKTTKKKATAKKKASSMETLIVGSKVKAAIKENGCMTSGELLEALNASVHEIIADACQRAQNNKRSTVRAHDV
ncbi:MAG: hypothetical protein KDB53_21760 [Planctomycetes bacterium]|nr:hypothetical protein [Planctomycetota bacterium]